MEPDANPSTRLDYASRRPRGGRGTLIDLITIVLGVAMILAGVTVVGYILLEVLFDHPLFDFKWGIPL